MSLLRPLSLAYLCPVWSAHSARSSIFGPRKDPTKRLNVAALCQDLGPFSFCFHVTVGLSGIMHNGHTALWDAFPSNSSREQFSSDLSISLIALGACACASSVFVATTRRSSRVGPSGNVMKCGHKAMLHLASFTPTATVR